MIFLPLGLATVAVVLFFVGKGQGKKALDIASTETSTAAGLAREAGEVAAEIGPGSFTKIAELKGTIASEAPLKAEMSGSACVWYRSTVTREYEESYTERDSDGKTRSGTRRGSETVSSNERRISFMVRDETGSVEVDPEGASLDGVQVLSRFEQGDVGPAIAIGGFRLSLGALTGGRRTIGYKLEERALLLGTRIYVLGEARDDGGRLRVSKPAAKGGRFIISSKSEEQLLASAKTGSRTLNILSALFLAGGAVIALLMVMGVM